MVIAATPANGELGTLASTRAAAESGGAPAMSATAGIADSHARPVRRPVSKCVDGLTLQDGDPSTNSLVIYAGAISGA